MASLHKLYMDSRLGEREIAALNRKIAQMEDRAILREKRFPEKMIQIFQSANIYLSRYPIMRPGDAASLLKRCRADSFAVSIPTLMVKLLIKDRSDKKKEEFFQIWDSGCFKTAFSYLPVSTVYKTRLMERHSKCSSYHTKNQSRGECDRCPFSRSTIKASAIAELLHGTDPDFVLEPEGDPVPIPDHKDNE